MNVVYLYKGKSDERTPEEIKRLEKSVEHVQDQEYPISSNIRLAIQALVKYRAILGQLDYFNYNNTEFNEKTPDRFRIRVNYSIKPDPVL